MYLPIYFFLPLDPRLRKQIPDSAENRAPKAPASDEKGFQSSDTVVHLHSDMTTTHHAVCVDLCTVSICVALYWAVVPSFHFAVSDPANPLELCLSCTVDGQIKESKIILY